MGTLTFLFCVALLFGGAAAWSVWEERTGRLDERKSWHKMARICKFVALCVFIAYFLALVAHYHCGMRINFVAQ